MTTKQNTVRGKQENNEYGIPLCLPGLIGGSVLFASILCTPSTPMERSQDLATRKDKMIAEQEIVIREDTMNAELESIEDVQQRIDLVAEDLASGRKTYAALDAWTLANLLGLDFEDTADWTRSPTRPSSRGVERCSPTTNVRRPTGFIFLATGRRVSSLVSWRGPHCPATVMSPRRDGGSGPTTTDGPRSCVCSRPWGCRRAWRRSTGAGCAGTRLPAGAAARAPAARIRGHASV